ncbi:hypothetical protein L204_102317 [Cryptococcus depauperatus]|nr:RNA polymerase II transcription factor [Cryptococcus depauperatus CBS 7855]
MSFVAPDDRTYYNYSRVPGSAHSAHQAASPGQRIHSHGYPKSAVSNDTSAPVYHHDLGPGNSHGYPPQPITPLTGQACPPPASTSQYYGMPPGQGEQPIPSPPPSSVNGNSAGRPAAVNSAVDAAGPVEVTTEGVPVVPVGVSGGKMFRCRGYGDCNKVFTRSEHLARHVRKHTGERPFPCHCGKAFSRLDNLRQHAATVHAEQPQLNETMLASLAPIHAALSQRASKDQRRRGEIVEVPKNAIERPRNERKTTRTSSGGHQGSQGPQDGEQNSPYAQYHDSQWSAPAHSRSRTGNGYEYPYAAEHTVMDGAGPSRRPNSATGYAYPQEYYDQGRPPTTTGTSSSSDSNMSQLPYPYRPVSSQGRELPVPVHYADSEPSSAAHGPPQSPMYNNNIPPNQPNWSSPPPNHSSYPPHDATAYPPPEGYSYPPAHHGSSYPPREDVYGYPPQTGWQQGQGQYPPQTGASYQPVSYQGAPPESPFHYHATTQADGVGYPYQDYDSRKRRADEEVGSDVRKMPRPSAEQAPPGNNAGNGAPSLNAAMAAEASRHQDPSWLPPATERRGSLAISALLGSPPRHARSRPQNAEGQQEYEGEFYEPMEDANASHEDEGDVSAVRDIKNEKIQDVKQ